MMMHQARSGHHPAQQQGLSLLELLLVVVILSAASLLALELYGNNDNQLRFEQTRQRLQQIRHAIIGNPQQNRSGFVQDMGRLPVNLRELVQPPISCDGGAVPDDDPNNNGVPDDCEWEFDDDSGLWAGWRGPYLDTLPGINGALSFRDAWGNTNPGAPENFGWRFETNANGDVFVQSRGLDQQANPADAATFAALNDYERDYPPSADALDVQGLPSPLISFREYKFTLNESNVYVDLGKLESCWSCSAAPSSLPLNGKSCLADDHSWFPREFRTNQADCELDTDIDKWMPQDTLTVTLNYISNGQVITYQSDFSIQFQGQHEQIVVSIPVITTPESRVELNSDYFSHTVSIDTDNDPQVDSGELFGTSIPKVNSLSPQGQFPLLHWSVF
jgi:prepilin-type N-terminal cleavage/methylation domain-containing protein